MRVLTKSQIIRLHNDLIAELSNWLCIIMRVYYFRNIHVSSSWWVTLYALNTNHHRLPCPCLIQAYQFHDNV